MLGCTLHRRPEKTERKSVGKRQEKEKKQGTRKKREKTGTGWKDKGMAVRTAERKKRKNCNYATTNREEKGRCMR